MRDAKRGRRVASMITIGYIVEASRWSKPQRTREAYHYDSYTTDGVNDDKAQRVRGSRAIQMPLRGRGGRKVRCRPDFPSNCVYELVTGHKEQLTNEVHRCGMDWHGIRIRIVTFGPEEVREKFGDGE